jgi:hypothetical protein
MKVQQRSEKTSEFPGRKIEFVTDWEQPPKVAFEPIVLIRLNP